MYKRLHKELKRGELSSSESESAEEVKREVKRPSKQKPVPESASSESGENSDHKSAGSEASEEVTFVTMDELEAGDKEEKKKIKPKRNQELLYQCSICPEKQLNSLAAVKIHIESSVRRPSAFIEPHRNGLISSGKLHPLLLPI